MLTFQQARQMAEDKIKAMPLISDTGGLTIIDSETIEKSYAWIFFYDSKRHMETGDIMCALGGNAPLFISKTDGQIFTFRTGLSIDAMIEEYEEKEQIWKLSLTDNIYADNKKLLDLKRVLDLSNRDIAGYKSSNRLTLDTGSEARLLNLQKALNDKNIQTHLLQQNLS